MALPTRQQFVLCHVIDCNELTDVGHLCERHAVDLLGLRVATSGIANAGLGLYTTRPRRRGEYVCDYVGRIVSSVQFDREPDDYGVQLSHGRVLSARCSTDGFARFANDAQSTSGNNCLLVADTTCVSDGRSTNEVVQLVTTRNVEAGAELLVSYGTEYWERQQRIVVARIRER